MQAAVVHELIRRRKLCQPELAHHLAEAHALRGVADYHARDVSRSQATQALRRATSFLARVKEIVPHG